jgi:hypothetical protein
LVKSEGIIGNPLPLLWANPCQWVEKDYILRGRDRRPKAGRKNTGDRRQAKRFKETMLQEYCNEGTLLWAVSAESRWRQSSLILLNTEYLERNGTKGEKVEEA